MKKTILYLLCMLSCFAQGFAETYQDDAESVGISFSVPEGFAVKKIATHGYDISSASDTTRFALLYYDKVTEQLLANPYEIPDTTFFKVADCELLSSGFTGDSTRVTLYHSPARESYIKIYRHVHPEGMSHFFVVSKDNDFSWADSMDASYQMEDTSASVIEIIGYVIALIVMVVLSFFSVKHWGRNWPKFIVYTLACLAVTGILCLVATPVGPICILLMALIVLIADRNGYTIIPI